MAEHTATTPPRSTPSRWSPAAIRSASPSRSRYEIRASPDTRAGWSGRASAWSRTMSVKRPNGWAT